MQQTNIEPRSVGAGTFSSSFWQSPIMIVSIVLADEGEAYQGVLLLHLHLALVELLLHRVLVAAPAPLPFLLPLHLTLFTLTLPQERRVIVLSCGLVRPST